MNPILHFEPVLIYSSADLIRKGAYRFKRYSDMANRKPKGRQKMAALGRVGGVKSGESRRNRATELLMYRAVFFGAISAKEAWESTPAEIAARAMKKH